MNKIITALTLLTSMFTPALAGSFEDHVKLAHTVEATGIEFKINPPECDIAGAFGWYWAQGNELVVCQENKIKGSTQQVDWTEEDLDTLRHEAHHLVQDCRDGRTQGTLAAVYDEPILLAKNVLGELQMVEIIQAYSEKSAHIQVMELEAFSVAAMNDPQEQVRDIQTFCF